jgi:hypothetical protein
MAIHNLAELYQNSVRLASHSPVPAIAPDSLPGEHFLISAGKSLRSNSEQRGDHLGFNQPSSRGIPKFVVRLIIVRHRESVFNRGGGPTEITLLQGVSVVDAQIVFSRQESDEF